MQLIRKLLGSWTLPEDVYVCSFGSYWVGSGDKTVTIHNPSWGDMLKSKKNYIYVKIERNNWGIWEESSHWLGVNTPLPKLKKVAG
jgi:hypothetical protein